MLQLRVIWQTVKNDWIDTREGLQRGVRQIIPRNNCYLISFAEYAMGIGANEYLKTG